MDLLDLLDPIITPAWIQVGELGLAFIVIILCAGLVMYVMRTSSRREQELLNIITKVLPLMEGLTTGMNNVTVGMASINLRLESIEDNQMRTWDHKAPNKRPLKKNTIPRKPVEEIVAAVKEIGEAIEVPDEKVV